MSKTVPVWVERIKAIAALIAALASLLSVFW